MDLETFGNIFINTEAIYEKLMAPAMVGKLEGNEGVKKLVEQEMREADFLQRRLAVRGSHSGDATSRAASCLQRLRPMTRRRPPCRTSAGLRSLLPIARWPAGRDLCLRW